MLYSSQTLGLIISKERVSQKMTQGYLAGIVGISRSHLSALEGGKKSPNMETFWRIAEALSLKPSELLAKIENCVENGHRP